MSFNFKALSGKTSKPNPVLEPGFSPQPPKTSMTGLKIAILLSFLLSITSLVGGGILFNRLAAEKLERQALEASQAQLRQKAEVFEKSSEAYKADIGKVHSKLQEYESEKIELKKKLSDSLAQMTDLQNKMKAMQEKSKTIEDAAALQIRTADKTVPLQFSSSANLEDSSAASPVPSASSMAPPSPASNTKAAQILSVNRKFNFAVVNIGLSQKLKIGDVLEVVRGGKPAARLQVEKLYEGFCAASIVQEPKDAPIQEGDQVRSA